MTLRITGLIQSTKQFQHEISRICSCRQTSKEINFTNPEVIQLHERISKALLQIESVCRKQKGTPADLPNPSYQAYLWLRFLSEKKWLLSHLHGMVEFQDLLTLQGNKLLSRVNYSLIHLEIKNFNYLYRLKQKNRIITLEVNESFISAPKEIKEILLQSALGGRRSRRNQLIKEYSKNPEFKKISNALQTDNQINLISHQGRYFSLEKIFETLNYDYFNGKLERPRLTWSPRRSKRRLGYYHPESDAITISRSLDGEAIKPLLVEYILYHEMLHKSLGIRETNGRRYAHTSEFKKKEKRFNKYNQAIELMKQFCQ